MAIFNFSAHFRSFPIIPLVNAATGLGTGGHPHPDPLPEGEGFLVCTGNDGEWPRVANFYFASIASISFHSLSPRILILAWIPAFAGMTGQGHPHPDPLPEGEGFPVCTGATEEGRGEPLAPFGPVWPRLLLAARLEMGPPRPRLALGSLVRGGPAGPGCGLGWPRHEWPGVTKLLIQLHSVAFRSIPYPEPSSSPSPMGRRDSILRGNDGWGYPYCESLPVRFRSEGGQPLTHFDSF